MRDISIVSSSHIVLSYSNKYCNALMYYNIVSLQITINLKTVLPYHMLEQRKKIFPIISHYIYLCTHPLFVAWQPHYVLVMVCLLELYYSYCRFYMIPI